MTEWIILLYGYIGFGIFSLLFIVEMYTILKFLKLSEEAWNIMVRKKGNYDAI